MAKKYTDIGLYCKPNLKQFKERFPDKDPSEAKASIRVSLNPKDGKSIVLNAGDYLQFTTQKNKVAELESLKAAGKLSETVADKIIDLVSQDFVIATVTLVQDV
jgi:hypothetical protein